MKNTKKLKCHRHEIDGRECKNIKNKGYVDKSAYWFGKVVCQNCYTNLITFNRQKLWVARYGKVNKNKR